MSNCDWRPIETAQKDRTPVAEARLKIAIEALNKIAVWDDGPVVTRGFDNPHDAKIAREALKK